MPRPAGNKSDGRNESLMSSISNLWNRSYAADYVGFAILLLAYSLVSYRPFESESATDFCVDPSTRRAFSSHVFS